MTESAPAHAATYQTYQAKMQKIADVQHALAVLEWDQETYLPEKGAAIRSRQMATLSGIAHEWLADPFLGRLLEELDGAVNLDAGQRRNVALSREDYDKNRKYPADFVEQLSLATSAAYHAWIQARRENDYRVFAPLLEKMVTLKRRQADLLGYEAHPYDALADDFEKGTTVQMLDTIFSEVTGKLKVLVEAIGRAPAPDNSFLHAPIARNSQWDFGLELLRAMGFDFSAGRQDISEHPFTTSFNSQDVRLTTRINTEDFADMVWSCIHEGGHGLYEQGLPAADYGLPAGEAASLAIHESQSRLWENNVGRSRAYWQHFYPRLQELFPAPFASVAPEAFYRAINKVQPSLIRTEADEITYHFHIMIRYELEKKLIAGELAVGDLKEAWNAMYHRYLGVEVPDDRRGVLQDVHWSHGSFGYFPTYSLGSFYAAQFFAAATKAISGLQAKIAAGQTAELLTWLRKNIHQFGRRYDARVLCERVTGEALDFRYFMDYVTAKYTPLYSL
jgi:carboxypeptidase Taq